MRFKIISIIALLILTTVLVSHFSESTSANADRKLRVAQPVATDLRYPLLPVQWLTVVNNGVAVPGSTQMFSSYGQPSVNTNGMVVFRARSTGSSNRQSGIFKKRDLGSPVEDVADRDILVPFPNNLNTMFTEFPSFPRISMNAANVATVGLHSPVYRYLLPDGTETRAGTAGIYTQLNNAPLITGASKLGIAPGFEYFNVPNTDPPVPFSIFPGSSAINDNGTIVFKGNYSVNDTEYTGIFYRSLLNTPGGGTDPIKVIASSDMYIPDLPPGVPPTKFDSTSPPTVVGDDVVFLGLDNEQSPNFGGIYMASLANGPGVAGHQLSAVARIRSNGPRTNSFSVLGEGLAFDGRYVAFWGAIGNRMRTLRLDCPIDGNADLIAYCNGGDPNSIFDPETQTWYQVVQIPADQGIYLYDKIGGRTPVIISTTRTDFTDYLFWVYSGLVPGSGGGEGEAEPPRWRGSAFMSVSDGMVAFKARTATIDPQNRYVNIVDGIYMRSPSPGTGLETVVETGMDGSLFDPILQPGEMQITTLGIEREGMRGSYLAINLGMANAEEGWGGVYMANVTPNRPEVITKTKRK